MQSKNIVRTLRQQAGLKQADLAAAIGVSRAHISKVENGRDQASGSLKEALAVFFKVPIDMFFPAAADVIRTEPTTGRNNDEAALLAAWRQLPPEEQKAILVLARAKVPPR